MMTRVRPKEGTVRPGRCLFVYSFLTMSAQELPRDEIVSSLAPILASIEAGFRIFVVVGAEGGEDIWRSDDGRLSITRVNPLTPDQLPSLTTLALALLNRKVEKDGGTP